MATNLRHADIHARDALDRPDERLLVRLLKLSSLIGLPIHDALAEPRGLSRNEFRIVMCLGGEGACAGHEITRIMGIAPMNVSRALASLGERGWVEPADGAGNRRRKPMRLSACGRRIFDELYVDLERVAAYLVGSIEPDDAVALRRIVDGIIVRLEAWPPQD